MENKIHICRIANTFEKAIKLLDENKNEGYVTIGWGEFTHEYNNREKLQEYVREKNYEEFRKEMYKWDKKKSIWFLYHFLEIKKDDFILVPLYDGTAILCKAETDAVDIDLVNEIKDKASDWSFVVKVKDIIKNERKNASPVLQRKMKTQGTYLDITDCREDYNNFMVARKPLNLYDVIVSNNAQQVLLDIKKTLNDKKFEKLILWYFERIGATDVYIPAKNEHGKTDGADSDINATFEDLKLIIRVQAKLHDGETSGWAIDQIKLYGDQMDNNEEYKYLHWVISTGDFNADTKNDAVSKDVRLIDGIEFSKMLLNVGMNSLKMFFDTEQ